MAFEPHHTRRAPSVSPYAHEEGKRLFFPPSIDLAPGSDLLYRSLGRTLAAVLREYELGIRTEGAYVQMAREMQHVIGSLRAEFIANPAGDGSSRVARILESVVPFLARAEWVIFGDGSDPPVALLELRRFIQDLNYHDMIARGGLDRINTELAQRLQRFKAAARGGAAEKEADDVNDLLRRAIYNFPHLARGVVVELHQERRLLESTLERHVGRNVVLREMWNTLMAGLQDASLREPRPIVYPLPYVLVPHRDKDRRTALEESFDEIKCCASEEERCAVGRVAVFDTHVPKVTVPPRMKLLVGYEHARAYPLYAQFLPEEIDAIRFTAQPLAFVPWVKDGSGRSTESRPHWVMHYLLFRDFRDIGRNREFALKSGIAELEKFPLLEPHHSSSLIDVEDNFSEGVERFERGYGYVAYPNMRDWQKVLLFRFSGAEVPLGAMFHDSDKSGLQRDVYKAVFRADHPLRERMHRFDGKDVVEELMRVPVEQRQYS